MDAGVPFLLLGIQSTGKIGVGFTIDTDFFDNFFDSEGNLFFFFFRTKTLWAEEPHTTRSVEHEIRYSIDEWQYAFDLKLNPCRKTNNSSPSTWQSSQNVLFEIDACRMGHSAPGFQTGSCRVSL